MPRKLHFILFYGISFALHAALIIAILLLAKPAPTELPFLPARIVDLPPEEIKKLPPVTRPVQPPPPATRPFIPEKPLPPSAVPTPKKFGTGEDITLPKTSAPKAGIPEGAEQGKETGKAGTPAHKQSGPLPFLTQNDIDELARKGMPAKKPGDDSVTLDTDEFKFMSYNRWLKIKIESVLRYPELAAESGYHGALFIKFDIQKDGSLGDLEVLKSSGFKILDDEALRAIRAAAPFQPLPDDWGRDRYSIRAAVIFYLGTGYIR
ncbi:MAG TPA: energy transducer TonB [Nitrospirota bacterium]|nr:energy transducer TonB [Nitrospirota bacterium]